MGLKNTFKLLFIDVREVLSLLSLDGLINVTFMEKDAEKQQSGM